MNDFQRCKSANSDDVHFSPKYFLRCHSKQRKDAADVQTQVWQCAFEPTKPNKQPKVVATCGGNTVCFIDIETGQTNKKYYSSNSRENFLALAWTTINGHNILAAGGSVQTVNFIVYSEGFCFHEERFERSVMSVKCGITSLLFHPNEGNIMYCSCSDGKVIILDIGSPNAPNYFTEVQFLNKFQVTCEVFLLIYYQPREILLGTSDDGIYCWKGSPHKFAKGEVKDCATLVQFRGRPLALTESPSLVDTAEVLENGLIASKCALHGAIYIWNLEEILGEEGIPDSNKTIRISPLYQLEWSDTDNYFMYLGYDKGSKILACGDDKGAIWTYDIKDVIDGRIEAGGEMIQPTTIFEWPNLQDDYITRKRKLNLDVYDIVINKIILSYKSKSLVAVTNNNMVCIWKRSK